MKVRNSFVSNSSSTSFVIKNKSNEKKSIVDFVKETPHLIIDFREEYDWNTVETGYTQERLLESAKKEAIHFKPQEEKILTFGDEQGTLIGEVFDYILRDGGESKSFTWKFHEYNR